MIKSRNRPKPASVAELLSLGVAFRFVPEWTLLDLKWLTGPHWTGKYALAPEKYGIGPEKLRGEWSRE
jgi:hypothetical protein